MGPIPREQKTKIGHGRGPGFPRTGLRGPQFFAQEGPITPPRKIHRSAVGGAGIPAASKPAAGVFGGRSVFDGGVFARARPPFPPPQGSPFINGNRPRWPMRIEAEGAREPQGR